MYCLSLLCGNKLSEIQVKFVHLSVLFGDYQTKCTKMVVYRKLFVLSRQWCLLPSPHFEMSSRFIFFFFGGGGVYFCACMILCSCYYLSSMMAYYIFLTTPWIFLIMFSGQWASQGKLSPPPPSWKIK